METILKNWPVCGKQFISWLQINHSCVPLMKNRQKTISTPWGQRLVFCYERNSLYPQAWFRNLSWMHKMVLQDFSLILTFWKAILQTRLPFTLDWKMALLLQKEQTLQNILSKPPLNQDVCVGLFWDWLSFSNATFLHRFADFKIDVLKTFWFSNISSEFFVSLSSG